MRTQYENQLVELKQNLGLMSALCMNAIESACDALLTGNQTAIEQTRKADEKIDQMERDIEASCLMLLLRQQPVASDLRLISSALKMITDLERIGDQASDIAALCQHVKPSYNQGTHIAKMASEVIHMLRDGIEAYQKLDLSLARSTIAYDDVVDDLFCKLRDEVVQILIGQHDANAALDLLMVAKYLERIGDHATNIAEWAEYTITGVHASGQGCC